MTDKNRQIVDVRLNGVRAQCTAEANGDVLMEVKAGLKLTRNLDERIRSGCGPSYGNRTRCFAVADIDTRYRTTQRVSHQIYLLFHVSRKQPD